MSNERGRVLVYVPVNARTTETPGLAVHKMFGGPGGWWSVTHVASGMRIASFETRLIAEEAANRLGKFTGWETLSAEEIKKAGVGPAVKKLREELGGV